MTEKLRKLNLIDRYKVLAVVRGDGAQQMRQQAEASLLAGCHILELSVAVPGAIDLIASLRKSAPDDVLIGAGTVQDTETCRLALIAGADFITSPAFDPQVCRMVNRYCSVYFAGCFTATEIKAALESGTDIIKLFPAGPYDPGSLKSLQTFFPGIALMPAGGVNASNVRGYLDAGVFAVGCPFGKTAEEIAKNYAAFLTAAALNL